MNVDSTTLEQQINHLASQCVRCGLCLTVCPTYQINRVEAESPRGRIQLLAAVAKSELSVDVSLKQHITQCLSCRQCETVCPTNVPYEQLLIHGRTLLQQKNSKKAHLPFIMTIMTAHAYWRRWLFGAYRACSKLGLLTLSHRLGLLRLFKLKRLLRYLPRNIAPTFINAAPYYAQAKRGSVLLLTGCSSAVLEPHTLRDAVRLLTAWGYDVIIPKEQGCCGALHAHAGFNAKAQALAAKNTALFQAQPQKLNAIIQVTTGCASTWQTYTHLPAPIVDIQQFLLDQWPSDLALKSLTLSVAVHSPCSQRNGMGSGTLSMTLLSKIPQIHLIGFGDTTCCGAAGDYFLKQPQLSDQLGQQTINTIAAATITEVVSANIGCRLQLAKQWADQGIDTLHFCHPISLLARAV